MSVLFPTIVYYKTIETLDKTTSDGELCLYEVDKSLCGGQYLFLIHPDNLLVFLATFKENGIDAREFPVMQTEPEEPVEDGAQ